MPQAAAKYVRVMSHSNLQTLLADLNEALFSTQYRPLGGVSLNPDGKYYITLYDEASLIMDVIESDIKKGAK